MLRKQLVLSFLLLIAASGFLHAQSPTGGTTFLDIISPGQKMGFTIKQNYEHNFAADLSSGYAGDLAVNRYTTGIDYNTMWDRGFWRVGFGFEYNDWQWSGPSYIGDTYELTLQTIFGQRFVDSDWGLVGILGASLGAEYDSGNLGRGGSYLAGLGVTYYFSPKHTLTLGALAIGQEEHSMFALPLIILNLEITEGLTLRTFNGFTLSYDLSGDNTTSIDLTGEYENDLFRMDTETLAPGVTRTPIVEKESAVIAMGVTQRFDYGLYIRGYIEGIVYRKFEFRDNHSTYRSIKTDPAIGLGIQGGWNF